MRKSLPPLNWFRAFEASARRLSFTAAAHEIGMTQSAVSQQIRALETRLNVSLFERRARGLTLTDAGRKLLPQVEAALENLAQATGQFELGSGQSVLTISASVSVTDWIISPALDQFLSLHPGVSIHIRSAIWPDEFNAVAADVEVRFGSEKQVGKNARAILPNQLVPVKSPALSGPLASLPLIEAVGISQGWHTWGAHAGLTGLVPSLYVDSYGLALRFAADGHGVALVSSALVGNALQGGQLVLAHGASIAGTEGYYLSYDADKPRAKAFADWLNLVIGNV